MAANQVTQQNTGPSTDTKSLITALLLIFLYPAGLITMWFWVKWPIWLKIMLSLPVLILPFIILSMGALFALNPTKNQTPSTYQQQMATPSAY